MSWSPQLYTARRIAGRILRTCRAGGLALTCQDEAACVDGVTVKYLSRNLRQRLGKLWTMYGRAVIESKLEDPERRSEVDDALDDLVRLDSEP